MAKKIKVPEDIKERPVSIIEQMLSLATSAFGLVAALAWNEVVKEFIKTYIDPHLPQSANIISLLIYAAIVTILAILVTLQLTRIQSRLKNPKKSS